MYNDLIRQFYIYPPLALFLNYTFTSKKEKEKCGTYIV